MNDIESNNLISIVTPVYFNEDTIAELFYNIKSIFESSLNDYVFEHIFVIEGSQDKSLEIIKNLAIKETNIKWVSLVRNFGQVSAWLCGWSKAKGEAIVTISADLQDPVELIPQFIKLWKNSYDFIIATRAKRKDNIIATIGSKIFYLLQKAINKDMPAGGFDYWLMSKRACHLLTKMDERNRFIQGDILWLKLKTIFIPYERQERKKGKSKWTLSKKIKYFIDGFLTGSYIPIRVMSVIGILTFLMGILYTFVILIEYLFHGLPFKGYAPIIILILFFCGLIILMLGLLGEYIWRLYDELRKRPIYLEDDTNLK